MTEDKFRFQGRFLHLTYKTHISIDILKSLIDKKIKKRVVKVKCAHEQADTEHPYKHTHLLIFIDKKVDWKNSRRMDSEAIHPNILPIKTALHWLNTWKYLDKENCILDELKGNEYPVNGMSDLRRIIQSHKSWKDVINDDSISSQIQRIMNWTREIYNARETPNYSNGLVLRTWQEEVINLLELQNERKILWVYDQIGGNGKSILTNYLIDVRNAFMCNGGKLSDIAYAYDLQPFIVFDLPRCSEEFIPYKVMECFKDGRFFSAKYNSCMKRFSNAKVVVFSNFLPDITKLSKDRWIIKELRELELKDYENNSSNPRGDFNIIESPKGKKKLSAEDEFFNKYMSDSSSN